jgi:hypothetical protein
VDKYIEFVKTLDCCHCHRPGVDPHHIIGIGMGAMGSKAHNMHSMPLCRTCHDEVHRDSWSYPQTRWLLETQIKALKAGILKL